MKIATVLKTGGVSTGTGIALTARIVLTNKHIVKEEATDCFVYFQGLRYKSGASIESKGCLDIGFIVTESDMSVGAPFDRNNMAPVPCKGDTMLSIGYPIFEAKGGFDDNPFVSRGSLISAWKSKEAREPFFC